ncbi:hypothetical protein RND81_04G076000 [Saponaria officinalis]|uniref:LysM domain-containing protein n=1 Tax=Saponaria officinalis TaxID=3572 RepID=A0AAW1LJP5_SAPOF
MRFETMINVNGYGNGFNNGDGNCVIYGDKERENVSEGENSPINVNSSCSSKVFPPSSSSSSSSSPRRYIEHHVTKMDTLAGVAIRYGVEVADVKKMNNLVTDLQMYALKTLQIPLPGRHPPSPCLSNGHNSAGPGNSDQSSSRHKHPDIVESFQSLRLTPDRKLSPAMCSLRDYYGLHGRRNSSEGCEMAVYNKGSTNYQANDAFSTSSSLMNPPLTQHRRSRSAANGFKTEEEVSNNVDADYRKWISKLYIRPEKTEDTRTPEKLLKEENGSGGWFSAITGKGLALRTKAASRINLASEAETGGSNGSPTNLGDSIVGETSSGVRKSSSTPSLQDQDGNGSSSIWKTSKWSLKPDFQAALANPIFDGLPKPITGRKTKAALD